MGEQIVGRTTSAMPGLDIAEQRAWQNFLDSALRVYATVDKPRGWRDERSREDAEYLDAPQPSGRGVGLERVADPVAADAERGDLCT